MKRVDKIKEKNKKKIEKYELKLEKVKKRIEEKMEPINKKIGHYGYITQPATGVAVVKGQVVVARNVPYKRRFS